MTSEDETQLEWYWIEYIMRAEHLKRHLKRTLWERAVLLVRAASEDEARTKGESCARSKEHSYAANKDDTVTWRFVEIVRGEPIFDENIVDGAQVYSSFYNTWEAQSGGLMILNSPMPLEQS